MTGDGFLKVVLCTSDDDNPIRIAGCVRPHRDVVDRSEESNSEDGCGIDRRIEVEKEEEGIYVDSTML